MKYFTIRELCRSDYATSHRIPNDVTPEAVQNLETLVNKVLDPVRILWGAPIRISSGYRCSVLNRAVGGSATSQHLKGEAADINTGSRDLNKQLFELIRQNMIYDQLINEHDFAWVHVSYREGRNRKMYFKI